MDVFQFAIYEQVEEVGKDCWIAAKEPSEFVNECVISVYKEGHCPPGCTFVNEQGRISQQGMGCGDVHCPVQITGDQTKGEEDGQGDFEECEGHGRGLCGGPEYE